MKSKYTFNEIEEFLDKCNAPGIKILNGTSKQFLKADGSLDTKEYLSTTGGTINGDLNVNGYLTTDKTRIRLGAYYIFVSHDVWKVSDSSWQNEYTLLHEGNYSNLIGNSYLKTTGGTINGTLTLAYDGSSRSQSIEFKDNVWDGYLFQKGGHLYWGHSYDGYLNLILHSGNVGNYNAGGLSISRIEVNNDITVLNSLLETKFNIKFATGLADIIQGSSDGIIVNYGYSPSYGQQWFLEETRYDIKVRYNNGGTWSTWKTLAFTDSDITGNAATATKLKNSVSLWGNTFDGTKSLSGKITLSNNTSVDFYSSDAQKTINAVSVSNANVVAFGWGAIQHGFGSNFYGKSLTFTAGEYASRATAMTITEAGNVNVGTNYLDNVKFSVHGGLSAFYVSGQTITLDSVPSNGLVLGGNIHTLALYLMDNGQFAIQSYRRNTGVSLALNLNPLGGAVNIASANANTNVLGHLFASKDLYMSGFLMMNHGKEGVYMTGKTISWHNTNDAYTDSLLTFAKDSFTIHPTLYANGLANFSSRVLIGAVTDDTESALQVKGKITVGHTAVDRLILTTQDVTAVFDGHDELDGWMDYVFKSDGEELFYIGAKESATSRFRRAIRFYGTVTIGGSLIAEGASAFGGQSTFNAGITIPSGKSITFVDASGNNHVLSWDDTAGGLKIDDKIITVN